MLLAKAAGRVAAVGFALVVHDEIAGARPAQLTKEVRRDEPGLVVTPQRQQQPPATQLPRRQERPAKAAPGTRPWWQTQLELAAGKAQTPKQRTTLLTLSRGGRPALRAAAGQLGWERPWALLAHLLAWARAAGATPATDAPDATWGAWLGAALGVLLGLALLAGVLCRAPAGSTGPGPNGGRARPRNGGRPRYGVWFDPAPVTRPPARWGGRRRLRGVRAYTRGRAAARRSAREAATEQAATELALDAFRRGLGGVAAAPAGWPLGRQAARRSHRGGARRWRRSSARAWRRRGGRARGEPTAEELEEEALDPGPEAWAHLQALGARRAALAAEPPRGRNPRQQRSGGDRRRRGLSGAGAERCSSSPSWRPSGTRGTHSAPRGPRDSGHVGSRAKLDCIR